MNRKPSESIPIWSETHDGDAAGPAADWPAWTDDVVGLGPQTGVTRRQCEVMAAIVEHRRTKGMPPSFKQLTRALGIGENNPNAITGHLRTLQRKGWIEAYPANQTRSLIVISSRERARRQLAATAEIAARFERDLAEHPTYRRRGERMAVAS